MLWIFLYWASCEPPSFLLIKQYGLLESQAESCSKDLDSKGLLDADILAVIVEQMTDFKRRLGIDYYVAGLSFDQEAIQRWLNDLLINSVNGLMFYVKGTKLFWNDLVYCFDLIGRAAQGFTLEPRQVRTLRYAAKKHLFFTSSISVSFLFLKFFVSLHHETYNLILHLSFYFLQTNREGPIHIHSSYHHLDHSIDTSWTCSSVRCHPKILPWLLPKLFHRTETKFVTTIWINRVLRVYHQGDASGENYTILRIHCVLRGEQDTEFLQSTYGRAAGGEGTCHPWCSFDDFGGYRDLFVEETDWCRCSIMILLAL